jgi:DNA-binding transcriptional ArsR family regulator
MDQLIHTRELAVAIDGPRALDPGITDAIAALFFPQMPQIGRQAGIVGPEVPVPQDATAQDRLRGAMGRDRVADAGLDEAVRAKGHSGRRVMLLAARDDERSAGELARAARLSPLAASPHLTLVREVGLMTMRVDAKRRLYRVDPSDLALCVKISTSSGRVPWATSRLGPSRIVRARQERRYRHETGGAALHRCSARPRLQAAHAGGPTC